MKYLPARSADPDQVAALKKMRGKPAFALFMGMRVRKSKPIVDDFGTLELSRKVRNLCIIAPGGAYKTWDQVLKDDLSTDLKERIRVHIWTASKTAKAKRDLAFFMLETERPRAFIMNIEGLSRVGDARKTLIEFLDAGNTYVALDESVAISNNSKRTKWINKFVAPRANYRRLLSGLPTPRDPLQLFFQFEFLDWNILGFRSYWAFRAHVAILKQHWFGGRTVQLIDKESGDNGYRPEAIAEFQKAIEPYSFRVQFVPKVPTKYRIHAVTMTPKQRKAYDEIKEFACTQLASMDHVTATVVIAQITRMHQVLCGHVVDENGKLHELPENKTQAVVDILKGYKGKSLIWCSYNYNVINVAGALRAEFGKNSTAIFCGLNPKNREDEEQRFKKNAECRFMVSTPDAGGKGRTWDNADLSIYFSSRDNLDHRDQSEMRTMGKTKDRGVEVIDIVTPHTVETKILEALRKKINMASALQGDAWREWII